MNPPYLRLSILSDPAQLEALRPAWNELLANSACNEPMLSPLWLFTWWRVYGEGTGRKLCIGQFFEGDRLVGLAPLCRRRYWHRPGIPFRRLEFLGSDVDENDGVCSDYLNVLAESGYEEAVARALASSLAGGAFGPWDEIVLAAMDGDSTMSVLLFDAFRHTGLVPSRLQTTEAPHASLPTDWETYLKKLDNTQRYFIRRSMRDFDAWAGKEWQLHQVKSAADLEEGKRILTSLHTERWGADNQAGVFQSRRFTAFHDAAMEQWLQENRLELLWLSVRGEPIAAVYDFVWQGKVYFYQTGRKLDVPREVRPGVAILVQVLKRAIEAGHREVDFLGGVSQNKMKLATGTRPIVQLRVARRSLVEWTRRLAELGIAGVRRLRDRIRK